MLGEKPIIFIKDELGCLKTFNVRKIFLPVPVYDIEKKFLFNLADPDQIVANKNLIGDIDYLVQAITSDVQNLVVLRTKKGFLLVSLDLVPQEATVTVITNGKI